MRKRIALPAGAALIASVALSPPGGAAGQPGHTASTAASRGTGTGRTAKCGRESRRRARLRGHLRRQPPLLRAVALHRRRVDDAAARRHVRPAPARPGSACSGTRPARTATSRCGCSSATTRRRRRARQQRRPGPLPGAQGAGARLRRRRRSEPAWIAVNCGHEIQINDNDGRRRPARPARSTGSPTSTSPRRGRRTGGVWNDLEIEVIGQTYTVFRNGVRDQRVRQRAGHPVPGPPGGPGLGRPRPGRLHRPPGARRADGHRVVPQRADPRHLRGVGLGRLGEDRSRPRGRLRSCSPSAATRAGPPRRRPPAASARRPVLRPIASGTIVVITWSRSVPACAASRSATPPASVHHGVLHGARGHRVDADALPGELLGERLGQVDIAAFAAP